jgi:hypothetical protein
MGHGASPACEEFEEGTPGYVGVGCGERLVIDGSR